MNLRVVPTADEAIALASARAVLRQPEVAAAEELRTACEYLRTWGDWLDLQRAQAVLDRLEREELWVEPAPVDPAELDRLFDVTEERALEVHGAEPSPLAELARDVIECACLFVLLFSVFWIGYGAGVSP